MGILNLADDSFYDGGRYSSNSVMLKQVEKMLADNASFIDIGAESTRPGAHTINSAEELMKLLPALKSILHEFPGCLISVDTYKAETARIAVENGASIINDISGGEMDKEMFDTVAGLQVPYILMHMQGTPANMQVNPQYENVVTEVMDFFISKVKKLKELGVNDIIIDPGFGFGKAVEHNFSLLANLSVFRSLGSPVLAGLSRKSMIWRTLGISPSEALNGTTALNMLALQNGADILRVHDVKEAWEVVKLWKEMKNAKENL